MIGVLDERHSLHERAAKALEKARADELIIPASAYAEVLVGAFKLDSRRVRDLDETLERIPVRIEPVSAQIARSAARLRASDDRLRLADAFVLATADVLGATVLTGDRGLARNARARLI